MITLSSAQLYTWIAAFIWPLTRILGLIATAPLFGNLSIPVRVKLGLGVMLTLVIAPMIPASAGADPISWTGLLILIEQLVIGISMGFAMRVIFSAVEMAGEVAGLTMGFGFATFFDPQTRARSSAIAQFLALLTLMLFLALDIHLAMLSALAESFIKLPISATPVGGSVFRQIASMGGLVFSVGAQLALPIIAALLVTNIALGILTRSAPQLNLFGIGFPITLGAGFIVLTLMLPYLGQPIERLFQTGLNIIDQLSVPVQSLIR